MCGDFTCTKNALTALNLIYIIIAGILIGVGLYGRASAVVTSLPIIGGILACGVALILISMLGLIGAIKHHQVMLFFYMLILFLLFLIQFSIACACLAVNAKQQEELADHGWKQVDMHVKEEVQNTFYCCGFNETSININHETSLVKLTKTNKEPSCLEVNKLCCKLNSVTNCKCPSCVYKLQATIDYAFKLCGGIGLFFSFTEFIGVWLTVRYRNQKDPRANPGVFL